MAGPNDERRAITVLSNIDWSFDTPLYSRTRNSFLFDCRKHHWYPATFVREIPYSLIEVLSQPGEVVYDPFGGIGTTVLQALVLGRRPYAIERCRVAVEYVRAVWTLLDRRTDIESVRGALEELRHRYDSGGRHVAKLLKMDEEYGGLLREWFHEDTFKEIAFLILEERQHEAGAIGAAFRVALSATLKAVAAQDRGWGCIADNMLPKAAQLKKARSALGRFRRNCTLLLRRLKPRAPAWERMRWTFLGALKSQTASNMVILETTEPAANGVSILWCRLRPIRA